MSRDHYGDDLTEQQYSGFEEPEFWNRPRGKTMTIRIDFDGEKLAITYGCPCEARGDLRLQNLMADGATASVWAGTLCVVPDVMGWERLRQKLVDNASTLLRT